MLGRAGILVGLWSVTLALSAVSLVFADDGRAGGQRAEDAAMEPPVVAGPLTNPSEPAAASTKTDEEPDWYKELTEDEIRQLKREEAARSACKLKVCRVLVEEPLTLPAAAEVSSVEPITCDVARTYFEPQLIAFFKPRRFNWTYGHARCTAKVKVMPDLLRKAMLKGEFVAKPEPHTVTCELKRKNEKTKSYDILRVKITAQPTVTFRDGRAEQITLGIQKTEAPWLIRGAVWAIDRLEANLDMFEGPATEKINHFTTTQCAELLKDDVGDRAEVTRAILKH